MLKSRPFLITAVLVSALASPLLLGQTPVGGIAPKALFDPTDKSAATLFTPATGSESQVTTAPSSSGSGVDVTINPGDANYPGVILKAPSPWDLSPYGNITATVTNTGTKNAAISLRADNDGDWHVAPWDTEMFTLKPGETKPLKLIFGYSYGYKPGYALKSNAVIQVMVFTGKVAGAPMTFHIDSIEASGSTGEKPPVDPSTVKVLPVNGYIVGPGVTIDAAKQLVGKGGATGSVTDTSIKADFPAGKGDQSLTIKPAAGKWDLREALELKVKVKNEGQTPVTPTAFATSDNDKTPVITSDAPIAPGAEAEIVVPFINPNIYTSTNVAIVKNYQSGINTPGTGNAFQNNKASSVTISVPGGDAAQSLTIESIVADLPPYSAPDWLGTKPPVDGDWTKTFDEEFDGTAIDKTKWNTVTDNFWDKRTHFTDEETVVSGGVATLRYEKKTGVPGNNPSKPATDYAAGYLDTYGKWTQRYGYWEARFKLPKAPGLWPAFWLMPDRGAAAGEQWKRASTGIDKATNTKGMEFDITEYLSGWGPYRYNIAMHWDGYDKDHKSAGQTVNYVVPDKDGFITTGLLWLPGKAIYYANGKEILHFENDRVADAPANIIFNYVSGGWDNLPLEDSKLPADFVIDYVRVWQRKDLASDVDGPKTPAAK